MADKSIFVFLPIAVFVETSTPLFFNMDALRWNPTDCLAWAMLCVDVNAEDAEGQQALGGCSSGPFTPPPNPLSPSAEKSLPLLSLALTCLRPTEEDYHGSRRPTKAPDTLHSTSLAEPLRSRGTVHNVKRHVKIAWDGFPQWVSVHQCTMKVLQRVLTPQTRDRTLILRNAILDPKRSSSTGVSHSPALKPWHTGFTQAPSEARLSLGFSMEEEIGGLYFKACKSAGLAPIPSVTKIFDEHQIAAAAESTVLSGGTAKRSSESLLSASAASYIRILDLTNIYCGPRGLLPLLEVIPWLVGLQQLRLCGCGLHNSAVELLCLALSNCARQLPELTTIDLRDNPLVGYSAGRAVQRLVSENPTLIEVPMSGCSVRGSTLRSIEYHLARNHNAEWRRMGLIELHTPSSPALEFDRDEPMNKDSKTSGTEVTSGRSSSGRIPAPIIM